MTGCFLVISEAAVSMCLKNKFHRKSLGKTLPLSVKRYHYHYAQHNNALPKTKYFFVIPFSNKKLHKNFFPMLLLCYFEKQPFSSVFIKYFLKFSLSVLVELYLKWNVSHYVKYARIRIFSDRIFKDRIADLVNSDQIQEYTGQRKFAFWHVL